MTKASIYRRSRSSDPAVAFPALEQLGEARALSPTTDSGYKSYGPGRLFLPAVTNLCPDPQGTKADGTFWPASTAHTTLTANQALPLPISGQPLITKCLKLVNDGTADTPATATMAVDASSSYTTSLYVYAPTLGGNLTVTAENGHSFTVAALTGASSGWTRYSVASNTVVGETTLHLHLAFAGGTASTVYVTGCMPEKSAVLTPYGDGSYSGWSWSGVANASTSTRVESDLRYKLPVAMNSRSQGFVAVRNVPLTASGMQAILQGNSQCPTLAQLGGYYFYHRSIPTISGPWTPAVGVTACGVVRWDSDFLYARGPSGAATPVGNTQIATDITDIRIGGTLGGTAYWANAYIGPVLISPTRISDAQTATLSSMLLAGATGIDLFRWAQREGLRSTLILPLESDSVGWVVA